MWKKTGNPWPGIILCVLLFRIAAAAPPDDEDLTINAHVDRTSITAGESLTLTITLKTGLSRSLPEPVFRSMEDFEISGSSTQSSSSISIVNGDYNSEKTISYLYTLVPRKTGDLIIPEAVVSYRDREYTTEPITVRVQKGRTPKKAPDRAPSTATREGSPEIYIAAVTNKDTVYAEEAVILEYFLYTRLNISDITMIDIPESGGFWWEEDTDFGQSVGRNQVVQGNIYKVYPIKRFVAYPLSPGEKRIEPLELGCRVRVRSRDIFDSFSIFGREKSITILSNEITLSVLPLPEQGKPPGFKGAVGNFTVKTTTDRNEVLQNEPVTITMTIEGKGNFKTMGEPELQLPDGVSVYPPDESLKVRFSGDNLSGKKVYEYIIIPREEGDYKIEGADFSYFDPSRHSYVHKTTSPINFTVRAGEPVVSGPTGFKTPAMVLGDDINYIKDIPGDIGRSSPVSFSRKIFLYSNMVSLLFFVGFFVSRKRAEKLHGNRTLRRHRYAGKDLKKTLKQARESLPDGDHTIFTQKCEKAIIEFVGNRLDQETTGMTIREFMSLLKDEDTDEATIALFEEWHDACQQARFSPGRMDLAARSDLLEKTKQLARSLGDVLP